MYSVRLVIVFSLIICCDVWEVYGVVSYDDRNQAGSVRLRFHLGDNEQRPFVSLVPPSQNTARWIAFIDDPELEEAIIVQRVFQKGVGLLRAGIRFCGYIAPVAGDAFGLINSWPARKVGQHFKSIANIFRKLAIWVRNRQIGERIALPVLPSTRLKKRIGKLIEVSFLAFARLFSGLSNAFFVTAETMQTMTRSLGQSVSDSFFSLDKVPFTIQAGVNFLLKHRKRQDARILPLNMRNISHQHPLKHKTDVRSNMSAVAVTLANHMCRAVRIDPSGPVHMGTPRTLSIALMTNRHFKRKWLVEDGMSISSGPAENKGRGRDAGLRDCGLACSPSSFCMDVPDSEKSVALQSGGLCDEKGTDTVCCNDADFNVLCSTRFCVLPMGVSHAPLCPLVSKDIPADVEMHGNCTSCDSVDHCEGNIMAQNDSQRLFLASHFYFPYTHITSQLRNCLSLAVVYIRYAADSVADVACDMAFLTNWVQTALVAEWTQNLDVHVSPALKSSSPQQERVLPFSPILHFLQALFALTTAVCVSAWICVTNMMIARWIRALGVLSILVACAVYMTHTHSSYLSRAVLLSEITAVDHYLHSLQTQHLNLSPGVAYVNHTNQSQPSHSANGNVPRRSGKFGSHTHRQSSSSNDVGISSTDYGPALETSLWVNGLLSSLWDKGRQRGGGMGEYLSMLAMEMINTQLRDLPSGIGNLYVQRLSFGAHPPLVRGVRTIERYESTCRRSKSRGQRIQHKPVVSRGGGDYVSSVPIPKTREDGVYSHSHNSSLDAIPNETSTVRKTLFHVSSYATATAETLISAASVAWTFLMRYSSLVVGDHTNVDGHDAQAGHDFQAEPKQNDEYLLVPCERVIVDVDTSYLSRDLDVVISLRKGSSVRHSSDSSRSYGSAASISAFFGGGDNIKTKVFTEMPKVTDVAYDDDDLSDDGSVASKKVRERSSSTATGTITAAVSEVAISGTIRLDAEVIDQYPFLGNATLSFLEVPAFDVTLAALGGIRSKHLSSLPVIQRVLNSAVLWYIQQYTYPRHCDVDLYAFLCPECLTPQPRPPTVLEALLRAGAFASTGVKKIAGAGRKWYDGVGRRYIRRPSFVASANVVGRCVREIAAAFVGDRVHPKSNRSIDGEINGDGGHDPHNNGEVTQTLIRKGVVNSHAYKSEMVTNSTARQKWWADIVEKIGGYSC